MSDMAKVSLRDLGTWSGGNTPSKANAAYWTNGTVPWVSPKDMKVDEIVSSEDRVSAAALADGRVSLVREGAVLFVTRSGILSHTFPVAVTKVPVTINQDLKALTPKPGVNAKYVALAVRGASQRILKACSKHGTTVASVDTKALLDFEVPVCSLREQIQIVAEIEKQFSRLDEAVANLRRVKANIRHYERAVLLAAMSGELAPPDEGVAQSFEMGATLLQRVLHHRRKSWSGRGRYQEPAAAGAYEGRLPDSWTTATIEQLSAGDSHSLAIGPFGSSLKVSDYCDAGVPLVFVRNIRARRFEDDGNVFVSPGKAQELHAHWVRPGDVLITKMGDPPGDVCIYPTHRPPAVITADCIKIQPSPLLGDGRFLAYAIQAPQVQRQIVAATKGVAQLKVSLGRFSTISVPLAPLAEQHRIVAEVDRRLSIVRGVEAEVDANLKRAQALRQAVLAKAFGG